MKLTRENIRVTIDNEEKQQRAIEILEKHGEKIWEEPYAMKFDKEDKYLTCDRFEGDWFVRHISQNALIQYTEITLDQLDELLTKLNSK